MNDDYDLTPEQATRRNIDKRLRECGWEVQNYRDFNPAASLGIAELTIQQSCEDAWRWQSQNPNGYDPAN